MPCQYTRHVTRTATLGSGRASARHFGHDQADQLRAVEPRGKLVGVVAVLEPAEAQRPECFGLVIAVRDAPAVETLEAPTGLTLFDVALFCFLRRKGAVTSQPRATPWVMITPCKNIITLPPHSP